MSENSKDKLIIGHYLVAFVDLLGQRQRLQKLDALPKDKDGPEYKEFIRIVKETIGAVDDLQRTAKYYFSSFAETSEKSLLNSLPAFERLNKAEIKFQHFSDGLVIYVPLRTDEDYVPLKGVYGALIACGGLCLLGLVKKMPVRIGVSIGIAAELRDNELYGKAVADAYEMEAFTAQYPRVVVTDEVLEYLMGYANQKCGTQDISCAITTAMAKASLQVLTSDFDGRAIVNYLGDIFRNDLMVGLDKTVFQRAYDFVDQQVHEHQESQNTKLALRYSILHGYFFHHLGEYKKGTQQ